MRADGGVPKGKIEKTRVVGVVMMLAGILSLSLAVAGVSGAGTSIASPEHHQCQDGSQWSSTTGQLAGAIDTGCNQTTTTTMHQCGCSTTTTMPVTTTSKPCNTTSTSTTTEASTTTSTMAPTTTTGATTTSSEVSGETSTTTGATTTSSEVSGETSTTASGDVVTTSSGPSISVEGVTSSLPGITVEPAAGGTLPFTGGSPFPLVIAGVVLLATGAGLSRKRRTIS